MQNIRQTADVYITLKTFKLIFHLEYYLYVLIQHIVVKQE